MAAGVGNNPGTLAEVVKGVSMCGLRSRVLWAGCAVLVLASGCAFLATSSAGPGLLSLMLKAESIVALDYPDATLFYVFGRPTSGTATRADDVNEWEFRFRWDPNPDDEVLAGQVWLTCKDGEFSDPVYSDAIPISVNVDALPYSMHMWEALAAVRDAGYDHDFCSVTLMHRVIRDGESQEILGFQPVYIFDLLDGPSVCVLVETSAVYEYDELFD